MHGFGFFIGGGRNTVLGQVENILDFAFSNDIEFYEKHLADLSLEEQAAFMEEFPDFLSNRKAEESDLGRKWDIQIYKSRGYVGYAWLLMLRLL